MSPRWCGHSEASATPVTTARHRARSGGGGRPVGSPRGGSVSVGPIRADSWGAPPGRWAWTPGAPRSRRMHPPDSPSSPTNQLQRGTALSRTLFAMALGAALAATLPLAGASADEARGEALFSLCASVTELPGRETPPRWLPRSRACSAGTSRRSSRSSAAGCAARTPTTSRACACARCPCGSATTTTSTAVAAYVASLPPCQPAATLEGGDATAGPAALRAVQGLPRRRRRREPSQLFAPPLRGASDWYLLTQLKNFKAGIRGADPADQTGAHHAADGQRPWPTSRP